jgi:hypothetical protein
MKIILLLLFLLVSPAFAQGDGNPENTCRNGAFPRDSAEFGFGTVKARKGERVYFYSDEEDCPNGKGCRQKSYLVNGNEVIASRTFGDFRCVWFQPKKGSETVGWIPSKNLSFIATLMGIELYVGKWKFYDNDIEIKATSDPKIFDINGTAFWKGVGDNIHIGELEGPAVWDGNKLNYGAKDAGQYDCIARLDLVVKYLVVSDNLNCGGANVTFSGVYRRVSN